VLVDRAPQLMGDAVDLDENLVEVPFVAGAGSARAACWRSPARTRHTRIGSSRR
jgi:hypothetical protein